MCLRFEEKRGERFLFLLVSKEGADSFLREERKIKKCKLSLKEKREGVEEFNTKRRESCHLSKQPKSFFCFSSRVAFSCTCSLIPVAKEVQEILK